MTLGKLKLKQQWDTTAHLLEWPKSRTLTTPNTDEDTEHQELSSGGMQNSIDTLEDSLAVLIKLHILLPYDPAITFHQSSSYPYELKIYCPHKNLHNNVNSNFIYNHQNLEATKDIFQKMNGYTVV